MIRLLFVGLSADSFVKMANAMQAGETAIPEKVASGRDALAWLFRNNADLVIAAEQLDDMTGLEFARKLVLQNPMVTCALVSSLNDDDFHEASEGLGIMAKLPPDPGEPDAISLLKKLKVISGLAS